MAKVGLRTEVHSHGSDHRQVGGTRLWLLVVRCCNTLQCQGNDLRRALLDAFRRGHVDFVELLLEYGASLEKLTVADIEQLYETVDVGLACNDAYVNECF